MAGQDNNKGEQYTANGASIKPIVPREGMYGSGDALSAIEGIPNPNAAKLFVDFVLSREGHDFESKALRIVSARKDVEDHSVFAGIQPPKVWMTTVDDQDKLAANFRNGVAAKALGVR